MTDSTANQAVRTIQLGAAGTENGTSQATPPRRRKNAEVRAREYLTEHEIEKLRKHASLRDSTMILLAFRHGLRVSELVALEWRDVQSLDHESRASITVRRLKGSLDGTHPLEPDEVRALRRLAQGVACRRVRVPGPRRRHAFRCRVPQAAGADRGGCRARGAADSSAHVEAQRGTGARGPDAARDAGRLPRPCADSEYPHLLARERRAVPRDLAQGSEVPKIGPAPGAASGEGFWREARRTKFTSTPITS